MANTDRARKLLVRTALATSTTIATLVGAQNFAMLDSNSFQSLDNLPLDNVAVDANTPLTIDHVAPDITISHVAPTITVLRHSGQVANTANTSSVQAPAPSQVRIPQPVVVRQPRAQRSRSTR